MVLSGNNKNTNIEGMKGKSFFEVISTPFFTEKSHILNSLNKYVFKTNLSVNKDYFKRFVEELYKVKIIKLNVIVVSKKKRTVKYNRGYQKSFKKFLVTLESGQSMPDFKK